jgi:hypothetical protein
MAREFFDFDPITGCTEYVEFTADGKLHITTEQDVEPVLDFAKELANSGAADRNFRKEGWLYAVIPPVVQTALFNKGINFLDPNHSRAMLREINTNYPWLKTTHKHHA